MNIDIQNNKDIINYNDKHELNGYQEWYTRKNILRFKCVFKNDKPIGYDEWHEYKMTSYHIR